MKTKAQLWIEVFRLIKTIVETETATPAPRKYRSKNVLAKHYSRIAKLATRPQGIARKELSKMPGFRPSWPTMNNLMHAAKANDCRIVPSGQRGKRRYRFFRKLKAVRAA